MEYPSPAVRSRFIDHRAAQWLRRVAGELWAALPPAVRMLLQPTPCIILHEDLGTDDDGSFVYGRCECERSDGNIVVYVSRTVTDWLPDDLLLALLAHEFAHAVLFCSPATRHWWADESKVDDLARSWGFEIDELRQRTALTGSKTSAQR